MQEVVCYNCGRIVHISPDAELCSVCGENLRELLHPVYASKYFYDRAAKMAAGSLLMPALQEIDRGLRYQPSSELRLLGAILSKRIGDFEQMRHHVAAIPVDDVLRPEGEWLLRSHQMRQRDLREANKLSKGGRGGAFDALMDDVPIAIQQVQPAPMAKAQPLPFQRSFGYRGVLIVLLLVFVAGGTVLARSFWLGASPFSTADETATAPVEEIVEPVFQSTQGQTAAEAKPTVALTPVLTPTATLAPDVPNNVVLAATPMIRTPEAVAASTPGAAAVISAAQAFDLQGYLRQLNQNELATLAVSASFQGTVLSLKGIVPTFEARQTLIELAESIPDVTSVSAVDLLVRLPDTYTVQPGDTLWDITYRLYGDIRWIDDLVAANRTLLTSPEDLSVGMVLQVPQIE